MGWGWGVSTLSSGTSRGSSAQPSQSPSPSLPAGRLRELQTGVNFCRSHTEVLGASRAARPVGPVGLNLSPRPARTESAEPGGTGRGAAGWVRRGRKGGILQEVDSQASACGHCQIFPTSLAYSLPHSLEDCSGPELLGWGRGAASRKSQIFEGRRSNSNLPISQAGSWAESTPANSGPRKAVLTQSEAGAPCGLC